MSNPVYDFISQVPPFSSLPQEELMKVSQEITIENFSRGYILSEQGKSLVENLLIIKNGVLKLFYDIHGKKIFTSYLKRGEICGGIAMLMNSSISVWTVEVDKKAFCYMLSKDQFLDLCSRYTFFYEYFVDQYSKRMLDESYASMIATTQAVQFLSGVVPFSFLPEEELETISSNLSIVHYPKGAVLFVQGQSRLDNFYVIQKGAAERYIEENDQKRLRGVLGEGDTYGGISLLLNNGIAVRTLRITEDSYFYILPKKAFFDLCNRYDAITEYFTDTFGKRMLDKSYSAIIAKAIQPQTESHQFFNQPVENIFNRDLVFCEADISIQNAAKIMNRHRCSSIFIKSSEDDFIGVVTDHDLRKKVIANGYNIQRPISDIMSSPITTVSSKALVFEALMSMIQDGIKHLAVIDGEEKVVGIVTNKDMLNAQGQAPFFLIREISEAASLDEIIDKHAQLPVIIKNLIMSGVKSKNVNRLITTISDAILEKLIGFALDEMGPPPSRFVFMIMGSEGRKEQTLKTDQDNAILYENVENASEEMVRKYFLEFGNKICTWLDMAGYAFCKGDVMAKNPKWCQPLSKWKEYFYSWIRAGEPEDLLRSSIFFDFRAAYGDLELVEELRDFLFKSLIGWPGFFRNLTENALYFKPPIGFFRNFVVESKGEHRNKFDIKSAMQPIVDFARIYALKNRIEETNTQERLFQLYIKKGLPWGDYNELEQSYSFMMQLRFVRQVTAIIDDHSKPDNYINPKKLSRIEQTMLKEIFKRIEKLQAKMGMEFTGIG
jgi:CBS domain-containing protein